MDAKFRALVDTLEPKFQQLVGMKPVKSADLPMEMPARGIYLFSEGPRHLYVGRTNRLKRRIQDHCRSGSGHSKATFAFRMARLETGEVKASYRKKGSRSQLEANPLFRAAFDEAKRRVAACDIRYVEETDPTRQALLEIYAATVLGTRYNDFENH